MAVVWVLGGSDALEEFICGGFDMRNKPDEIFTRQPDLADGLKKCTVVEGKRQTRHAY